MSENCTPYGLMPTDNHSSLRSFNCARQIQALLEMQRLKLRIPGVRHTLGVLTVPRGMRILPLTQVAVCVVGLVALRIRSFSEESGYSFTYLLEWYNHDLDSLSDNEFSC